MGGFVVHVVSSFQQKQQPVKQHQEDIKMPDQNEIGQVLFTAKKKKKPWKNGFYKMGDLCLGLARVRGPQQTFYQLKFLEHEDQSEQEMRLEEKEGEGEVTVTLLGETVDG